MAEISALPLDSSILDIIRKGIPSDTFAQQILAHIDPQRPSCCTTQHLPMDYKKFKWCDQFLYYNGRLYLPDGSAWLMVLE